MRFSIREELHNGLNLVRLTDHQSTISASLIPEAGAAWHEWLVPTPQGICNLIDNYGAKTTLDREMARSYKSAKLSPFVCRIPEGRYSWNNKTYEFPHKFFDGSAIHGLLFHKPFLMLDQEAREDMARVTLGYDFPGDDPGYPFHYRCTIRYTLAEVNRLKIETVITNRDHQSIPIADGWHPYFTLGGSINTYQLFFDAREMLEFNDQLVPTGKYLPVKTFQQPTPLGATFFDNSFLLNFTPNTASCTLFNPENGLKLSFYPDNSYPVLQIFTPDHRASIAVENLSGAPNCFNNKMGLTILEPTHTKTFTATYQIEMNQQK